MSNKTKARAPKGGRPNSRPKRFTATVPEADAAEYTFALIRSLMSITRDYRDFRLTNYFLEMAALDLAPAIKAENGERQSQPSRRATN